MENTIKIFDNPEFGTIRTHLIDNVPWFVAKDICAVLGIVNHIDAISRLDEDEKGMANTYPLNKCKRGGGMQKALIVNESGLYALIFQSRKPLAKAFRKWVTSQVLPAIRKTGGYKLAYPYEKKIDRLKNLREIDRRNLELLQEWVLNLQSERDIYLEKVKSCTAIIYTGDFSESKKLSELGKLIKMFRSERDVSPAVLSKLMGERLLNIKFSSIEQGKVDISLLSFIKILSLLDYSIQFIKNENL